MPVLMQGNANINDEKEKKERKVNGSIEGSQIDVVWKIFSLHESLSSSTNGSKILFRLSSTL